jgi:hypothetical protein
MRNAFLISELMQTVEITSGKTNTFPSRNHR